jgi:hypothetical protein
MSEDGRNDLKDKPQSDFKKGLITLAVGSIFMVVWMLLYP